MQLTWVACRLGVTQISLWTYTFVVVIVADTNGVLATTGNVASIYTGALVADLLDLTIIVGVALGGSHHPVAIAPHIRHRSVRAEACYTSGRNGVFHDTLL